MRCERKMFVGFPIPTKKKKNCDKAINKFGDRNHETRIGYLELVNYFQLLINKEISM